MKNYYLEFFKYRIYDTLHASIPKGTQEQRKKGFCFCIGYHFCIYSCQITDNACKLDRSICYIKCSIMKELNTASWVILILVVQVSNMFCEPLALTRRGLMDH